MTTKERADLRELLYGWLAEAQRLEIAQESEEKALHDEAARTYRQCAEELLRVLENFW